MASMSALTLSKDPRRMAWRVMIARNTSTRLSREAEGVECGVMHSFYSSPIPVTLVASGAVSFGSTSLSVPACGVRAVSVAAQRSV